MTHYRAALWLVVLALMLWASGPSRAAINAGARTTAAEVGEGLTCQCGCGLTVANCNHPTCGFAVPTRGEIAAMIAKGMTRTEILESFRHKFGEKVLSAPPAEGFNLLAWIMPFVMVGAGVVLIVMAIGRWRMQGSSAAASGGKGQTPSASGHEFETALRQQLERELRQQL